MGASLPRQLSGSLAWTGAHASMQQRGCCATSDGAPFVCTRGSVDGGADWGVHCEGHQVMGLQLCSGKRAHNN